MGSKNSVMFAMSESPGLVKAINVVNSRHGDIETRDEGKYGDTVQITVDGEGVATFDVRNDGEPLATYRFWLVDGSEIEADAEVAAE
jgi:hypothetical protein